MSKKVKPQVSEKNAYYIPKHRYYELKHFVMQYRDWSKWVRDYNIKYSSPSYHEIRYDQMPAFWKNSTAEEVERREYYISRMDMVDSCILTAFNDISDLLREYVFEAIVDGRSYDWIVMNCGAPFSRDYYYKRYRKFFWLLSQVRE